MIRRWAGAVLVLAVLGMAGACDMEDAQSVQHRTYSGDTSGR